MIHVMAAVNEAAKMVKPKRKTSPVWQYYGYPVDEAEESKKPVYTICGTSWQNF